MKHTMLIAVMSLMCGCAAYHWKSSVPADMRTVTVPTFRNESDLIEIGSIATRQVLREFQREGTFKVSTDGAIEIQGTITGASLDSMGFERMYYNRHVEREFTVSAEISVIDHRNGRVLIDNRPYTAMTTFAGGYDSDTGMRDASGRVADELARQIVDDVLAYDWDDGKENGDE